MANFRIDTYNHWPIIIPLGSGGGGGVQENGVQPFTRGGATSFTVTFAHGPYAPGYRVFLSFAVPNAGTGTAPTCWVTNRTSTTMDVAIAGTADGFVFWSVENPI